MQENLRNYANANTVSISLNDMSKVIVITGDLACGKSLLADSLSLRLNIPCFKKDVIKEQYVDQYGFETREENRALSVKAVDYMISALNSFVQNNNDIILEANFREEELLKIKEITDSYNCDVTLIVLRGDINILYDRFLKRLPTRHKAHMSLHLDESVEKFAEYVNEQRQEQLAFIPHVIDSTKYNEQEVLEMSLKYIQK